MNKLKTGLLILFAVIIVILIFFLVKNININENSENSKIVSEIKFMDTKIISLLNSETNWETLKNEIELLYPMIPTFTLDLYSINVSQDEILGFNKELDELTTNVKDENKEKTLVKLADLYRYLPVYASNATNNSEFINLLETKSNVIKAYVYVTLDNWEDVKTHTQRAIESYSQVFNNINGFNNYDKNKLYIILNELDSSANTKNKDVFIIKYKNFLEETEKIKY